jgi:Icc-related predicted phosphoesterase
MDQKLKSSDIILLGGDLTNFGNRRDAKLLVEGIRSYNSHCWGVQGNCDKKDVLDYLEEEEMSLHGNLIKHDGYNLIGVGGGLPYFVPTPTTYSEKEYEKLLDPFRELTENLIFISHQPPYNTATDMAGRGHHVGSHSIRTFIEDIQPLFCLTGHIHESPGIDQIGKTVVINPGPFGHGNYAEILINGKNVKAEIKKVPI